MIRPEQLETVIEVCHGPECREFGAVELQNELITKGYRLERDHCRGLCIYAPVAHIGDRCIPEATLERIIAEQGS